MGRLSEAWPLVATITFLLGIFVGLLIAPVPHPERPPALIGQGVSAATFNRLAEHLGCGQVEVRGGDDLAEAMRALKLCQAARR